MEKPVHTPLPNNGYLIETFGWQPRKGAIRWGLHLARLKRSASALGVEVDLTAVAARVEDIHADHAIRCRLTIGLDGEIDLTSVPMPQPARVWRVAVASERVDSSDPFLRHKTSQRALYDASRSALASDLDEVIFLNERDEVCEVTITNILVKNTEGSWLTPHVSCGCLPGVYRQMLLDSGQLFEAVVTIDDLKAAANVRLCNSLRGEINMVLVGL